MSSKPRAVITSRQAKDHIVTIKSAMEEMRTGMMLQQQKSEGDRMQKDEIQRDKEKTESSQNHEKSMQRDKLAVDALI